MNTVVIVTRGVLGNDSLRRLGRWNRTWEYGEGNDWIDLDKGIDRRR